MGVLAFGVLTLTDLAAAGCGDTSETVFAARFGTVRRLGLSLGSGPGEGVTIGDVEKQDLALCLDLDPLGNVGDIDRVDRPVADDVFARCHLKAALTELDGRGERTAVAGQPQSPWNCPIDGFIGRFGPGLSEKW